MPHSDSASHSASPRPDSAAHLRARRVSSPHSEPRPFAPFALHSFRVSSPHSEPRPLLRSPHASFRRFRVSGPCAFRFSCPSPSLRSFRSFRPGSPARHVSPAFPARAARPSSAPRPCRMFCLAFAACCLALASCCVRLTPVLFIYASRPFPDILIFVLFGFPLLGPFRLFRTYVCRSSLYINFGFPLLARLLNYSSRAALCVA